MMSYDLLTRHWRNDNEAYFPFTNTLCAPAEGTVPFRNSFLVVGGHGVDNTKNIYWVKIFLAPQARKRDHDFHRSMNFFSQFNPETRGWHKLPVEMRAPGHYMAAVILDESTINC